MSLVDTIPPLLLAQNARPSRSAVRPFVQTLKSFIEAALKRSPALLIVLGVCACEATRRNRTRVSELEASIAQLSKAIAGERATIRDRDLQISSLEGTLAQESSREAQREINAIHLERSLEAAKTKESSLTQQLASARDSAAKSHAKVEVLESQLATNEAEVERLKGSLEEETAEASQAKAWREKADRREKELVDELNRTREMISEVMESVEEMQQIIVRLEGRCEEQQQEIGSMMEENAKLRTEVDEAKVKDIDVSMLEGQAQDFERLIAERDTFILDLTAKVERLEFDQADIGDIPDRDSTLYTMDDAGADLQPDPEATIQGDSYELKVICLNSEIEHVRQVQRQKDDAIAELEGKVTKLGVEHTEKEAKIQSLLGVNRKHEERVRELEARVFSLASTNEELESLRREDRERFEKEAQTLRLELEDTNEMVSKVGSKLMELEAEAELKDAQVKSLTEVKQELGSRIAKREKSLADLRAKAASGQNSSIPLKPRKLQKSSRSKEGLLPDPQTCAQYEEKIAELTDKLSECHRLLKAGAMNSPTGLPPSPLWGPPPYDPAPSSLRVGGPRMSSSPGFATTPSSPWVQVPAEPEQRERFSAPQWSES